MRRGYDYRNCSQQSPVLTADLRSLFIRLHLGRVIVEVGAVRGLLDITGPALKVSNQIQNFQDRMEKHT